MALVNRRMPEGVRQAILPWLRQRCPGADDIILPTPRRPDAGGSSDTFFLDPLIREDGKERRESWVLRIEATDYQVYQDPSVERQYRVMTLLAQHSDVPVPRAFWYEPDRLILGAPFFLMECVPGDLLALDYHSSGLLTELAPAERETLWLSAVEAMARIHRVPVEPFQDLARPHLGVTGLDQEIAFWDGYTHWSEIRVHPVQERARRWLDDHMPESRSTGLAWGDARPCNMIFRDRACQAVIDWETVSLGGAETDLGWWLFWDWFITEGWRNPRLAGLGDRETTVKSWEHFVGRKVQHLEWHEVFATLRFSMIIQRSLNLARKMQGDVGGPHGDTDLEATIRDRLSALIGS